MLLNYLPCQLHLFKYKKEDELRRFIGRYTGTVSCKE